MPTPPDAKTPDAPPPGPSQFNDRNFVPDNLVSEVTPTGFRFSFDVPTSQGFWVMQALKRGINLDPIRLHHTPVQPEPNAAPQSTQQPTQPTGYDSNAKLTERLDEQQRWNAFITNQLDSRLKRLAKDHVRLTNDALDRLFKLEQRLDRIATAVQDAP